MNQLLTRRQCLPLLWSTLAFSYSSRCDSLDPVTPDEVERLRRTLVSLCPRWLYTQRLTAMCSRSPLTERISSMLLMAAILGDTSIELAVRMDTAMIKHTVARQIQLDFLRKQTMHLEGWILSRTEVYLYELAEDPHA